MKNGIPILITVILFSCTKKYEKFDLDISNSNYELNIKTGDFKINWYNNYRGKISLTKNEKTEINKLILDYNLDIIKGEKYVFGENPLIMPNFNDKFTITKNNKKVSEIIISTQVSLEKSKLNQSEIEIYKFRTEIFKLLNQNIDFIRNMDTLRIANKKIRRIFL